MQSVDAVMGVIARIQIHHAARLGTSFDAGSIDTGEGRVVDRQVDGRRTGASICNHSNRMTVTASAETLSLGDKRVGQVAARSDGQLTLRVRHTVLGGGNDVGGSGRCKLRPHEVTHLGCGDVAMVRRREDVVPDALADGHGRDEKSSKKQASQHSFSLIHDPAYLLIEW